MNGAAKADVEVRRRKDRAERAKGEAGWDRRAGCDPGCRWGQGVTWLCVRKCFPPPSPGESPDPEWFCLGEGGGQTVAEGEQRCGLGGDHPARY